MEDSDWTGTSYRGLDDEGDDAEGGGLFSEALGGYAGPPNWEAVRAAAATWWRCRETRRRSIR